MKNNKKLIRTISVCILIAALVFLSVRFIQELSSSRKHTDSHTSVTSSSEKNTTRKHTASKGSASNSAAGTTKKAKSSPSDFRLEDTFLIMKKSDKYQVSVEGVTNYNPSLSWSSSDSDVASVDSTGNITAKKSGTAVISCTNGEKTVSVYVNVFQSFGSGNSWDLKLKTGENTTRIYRNFKQNSHSYPDYNQYLAWHGCATCSLTTVLRAYSSSYKQSLPNDIIDGIEKQLGGSGWTKNHVTRGIRGQMPISMYGIASTLEHENIPADYVSSYQSTASAKKDIEEHLKTGNPVIIEVRMKSNVTGKKSKRWTNSYHTMILLGQLTNGHVLLSDAVDRSWYDGDGQRVKEIELDDVMEYMFSCTKDPSSYYYTGSSTAGGYIKVN